MSGSIQRFAYPALYILLALYSLSYSHLAAMLNEEPSEQLDYAIFYFDWERFYTVLRHIAARPVCIAAMMSINEQKY